MSNKLEASQSQKQAPTCGLCGRTLGVGFYYTCHLCGRNYCYAHIPVKCTHKPIPKPSAPIPSRIGR